MNKGQIAIEFLYLLGLSLLIIIIFALIISNDMADINNQKEQILIKDLVLAVQAEFFLAAQVGDNYYREFVLPDNLEGIDYTINVSGTDLYIRSEHNLTEIVLVPYSQGNILKGTNIIRKNNGSICINMGVCS